MSWLLLVLEAWEVVSAASFHCRASLLPAFVPPPAAGRGVNAVGREIRQLIPQDVFSDTSRCQFDRKCWLEEGTI